MNSTFTTAELQSLFLKWQAGRLEPHEARRLEQRRASSPECEQEWTSFVALWQNAASQHVPDGSPREAQWARLSARLDAEESMPNTDSLILRVRRWLAHTRPQPRWAFAGLAILLFLAILRFGDFIGADTMQTVQVPFGERVQLTLADGSRVELNAGSSLQYLKKFSHQIRRVELQGEAFFQVQRDEAVPFEITTAQATVRVLGTDFNVRAWESRTTVFVQSGKVAVRANVLDSTSEVILESGQAAQCSDSLQVLPNMHAAEDLLAWREGKLVFHRQPLAEVLAELERHFNVRMQAEGALLSHTVTAKFAHEPVTAVLDAIAAALDARYEINTEGYWLRVSARRAE